MINQGAYDTSLNKTLVSAIDGYVFISIGTSDGGSNNSNNYAEINGTQCLSATWTDGANGYGTVVYPISTGDSIHVRVKAIRTNGWQTTCVFYNVTFFTIN